jgi:hypothetical protein
VHHGKIEDAVVRAVIQHTDGLIPRALRVNDHENKADFCRPRMSMRGARGISSFQLSVWKSLLHSPEDAACLIG